jgi:hypothetical protein
VSERAGAFDFQRWARRGADLFVLGSLLVVAACAVSAFSGGDVRVMVAMTSTEVVESAWLSYSGSSGGWKGAAEIALVAVAWFAARTDVFVARRLGRVALFAWCALWTWHALRWCALLQTAFSLPIGAALVLASVCTFVVAAER